ncbi:MAG: MFS transporter [Opitutaceae bacterium]|nr:MFS transporter [Opitutaceae bacterium]
MSGNTETQPIDASQANGDRNLFQILLMLTLAHGLNDVLQAIIPAVYPILRDSYSLTFTQIAGITFATQVPAALLQPVIGWWTDRKPHPYALLAGMTFTTVGIVGLALTNSYPGILFFASVLAIGSAIFHPEASRLARLSSNGRPGFAQSLFQVGGNLGSSLGPVVAALIVLPFGQRGLLWMMGFSFVGLWTLCRVSRWYAHHLEIVKKSPIRTSPISPGVSATRIRVAIAVLMVLLFSKFVYIVCLTSFYTFYLIDRFGVATEHAQYILFAYLFATAVGTIVGGMLGDRFGRRRIIWASILGPAPLALLLPHVGLTWTILLSIPIGFVMAWAFSAIVVYGQELLPGRVGMISGLSFGLAFGVAGVAAVFLGQLADATSIEHVFFVCSFLPLLGVTAGALPELTIKK